LNTHNTYLIKINVLIEFINGRKAVERVAKSAAYPVLNLVKKSAIINIVGNTIEFSGASALKIGKKIWARDISLPRLFWPIYLSNLDMSIFIRKSGKN
jgi:hypothetical protein